jgi:hypothetical protein
MKFHGAPSPSADVIEPEKRVRERIQQHLQNGLEQSSLPGIN